jgi:hypothetical protein
MLNSIFGNQAKEFPMAGPEPKKPQQSEFLKDLQDRVAADPEMVEHVLDPNRTPETVRFRDPSVTGTASTTDSGTPQSVAEFEMARRTDAGRREPRAITNNRNTSTWLGGVAVLIVVILALVWMWGASSQ